MAISRSDMERQLRNMGGRIGFQEGGIMPRLSQLSGNVSSAEQMLQQINQRLQSAESSLGSGGGTEVVQASGTLNGKPLFPEGTTFPSGGMKLPVFTGTPQQIEPAPFMRPGNIPGTDVPFSALRGGISLGDNQSPLQKAIGLADGGMANSKEGGIMTLEDAKKMAPPGESLAYINADEAALLKALGGAGEDVNGTGIKSYFLKKLFKKAKRTVKKVVKSPIGKLGFLAAATLPFGGPVAAAKGLGGLFGGLGTKIKGMSTLGKLGLIGGASGLAGLLAGKEAEEEDEIDIKDRGEGLDIDRIVRLARMNDPQFRFLPGAEFTRAYAEGGGVMDLGGMEMDLRGGGFVPLGAKEKADDVPARLSKNEFVMTADAVRAAGGGSIDKGADKMYNLMKDLEARV
jgi:hypothetical protein